MGKVKKSQKYISSIFSSFFKLYPTLLDIYKSGIMYKKYILLVGTPLNKKIV